MERRKRKRVAVKSKYQSGYVAYHPDNGYWMNSFDEFSERMCWAKLIGEREGGISFRKRDVAKWQYDGWRVIKVCVSPFEQAIKKEAPAESPTPQTGRNENL